MIFILLFLAFKDVVWIQIRLGQGTVIQNGIFSALTLFDGRMLRNTYATYSRTSQTSRISEKFKKANEGHKAKIKARHLSKSNFHGFLIQLGSFGSNLLDFSLIQNSKAIKAKKATTDCQTCKFNWSHFFHLNLVFTQYLS